MDGSAEFSRKQLIIGQLTWFKAAHRVLTACRSRGESSWFNLQVRPPPTSFSNSSSFSSSSCSSTTSLVVEEGAENPEVRKAPPQGFPLLLFPRSHHPSPTSSFTCPQLPPPPLSAVIILWFTLENKLFALELCIKKNTQAEKRSRRRELLHHSRRSERSCFCGGHRLARFVSFIVCDTMSLFI